MKILLFGQIAFFLNFHWTFVVISHRKEDATAKTKDQVKSRFFLDVVIRKSAAILELFTSEDL
jgi:hypothetical protein